MTKTQKTFNPLECKLCRESDCPYRFCYESMYSSGQKIAIANCKRLLREKKR